MVQTEKSADPTCQCNPRFIREVEPFCNEQFSCTLYINIFDGFSQLGDVAVWAGLRFTLIRFSNSATPSRPTPVSAQLSGKSLLLAAQKIPIDQLIVECGDQGTPTSLVGTRALNDDLRNTFRNWCPGLKSNIDGQQLAA
jgi:hypothetical protein